jgi:tRNA dimethylallyltransferase
VSGPPRVLAIVGATATGKTAISEIVADRLDAEIVCVDSRQVFRELEIGTGKPTPAERAARPHHLYDWIGLGDRPTAGAYARAAAGACREVIGRGRLPMLVGGSGLYLRALMVGLADEPPHDDAIRTGLRAELEAHGLEPLRRRLEHVDPVTASRLAPRDTQRTLRALEVWSASGETMSAWLARGTRPLFDASWRIVEITLESRALDERIASRTRAMFEGGLVEETRALAESPRGERLARLRAIGYDEALALIAGQLDRKEAEARTLLRTRQLAKRQRTWFRHQIDAERLQGTGASVESIARDIQDVVLR